MVVIAMGLVFGGYAISLWGYCLVRGYDVTFTSLFGTKWVSAQSGGTSQNLPLPVDPGIGTSLA